MFSRQSRTVNISDPPPLYQLGFSTGFCKKAGTWLSPTPAYIYEQPSPAFHHQMRAVIRLDCCSCILSTFSYLRFSSGHVLSPSYIRAQYRLFSKLYVFDVLYTNQLFPRVLPVAFSSCLPDVEQTDCFFARRHCLVSTRV